jgi:hypothetical protein
VQPHWSRKEDLPLLVFHTKVRVKKYALTMTFKHNFSSDGLSRGETIDQPYKEEITDDPEVTEGTEVC